VEPTSRDSCTSTPFHRRVAASLRRKSPTWTIEILYPSHDHLASSRLVLSSSRLVDAAGPVILDASFRIGRERFVVWNWSLAPVAKPSSPGALPESDSIPAGIASPSALLALAPTLIDQFLVDRLDEFERARPRFAIAVADDAAISPQLQLSSTHPRRCAPPSLVSPYYPPPLLSPYLPAHSFATSQHPPVLLAFFPLFTMSEVLTNLETIDVAPISIAPSIASQPFAPGTPEPSTQQAVPGSAIRRISPLPPAPTIPYAGPSTGPQRFFYVAVRQGHVRGVYTEWRDAEKQVAVSGSSRLVRPRCGYGCGKACADECAQNHAGPVFKTFSTRLAAEAFVAGWDGSGRHSLPVSLVEWSRVEISRPSHVCNPGNTAHRCSRRRPARCVNTSP
jgi:hypothetical protein